MSRSLTSTAESRQQRLHRLRQLCEHVLDRSGAAVVHARLAVLMENPLFTPVAAASALGDGTVRPSFGSARTPRPAAADGGTRGMPGSRPSVAPFGRTGARTRAKCAPPGARWDGPVV
ncbi:hypothetical protein ACIQB5_23520 [Streptomyces sp. NPDC088560]|uniref:hypothetical protein n=1 Tax=Streptomyces sp. NPDC088560 TaxID=3365868 RepID=UPI00381B0D1F